MGTLRIEAPARKRALQEGNNQITLRTGLETHTTKGWKKFCCCQCNKDFQYVWAWCVNLSKDSVMGSKPHEHQKSSKCSLRSKSPSLLEMTLDSWGWLRLCSLNYCSHDDPVPQSSGLCISGFTSINLYAHMWLSLLIVPSTTWFWAHLFLQQ